MDRIDYMLLLLRPIGFVLLPAWIFHAWIGEAVLGAIIGFAYMWNLMATHENAQLAKAFKEVRDELGEIRGAINSDIARDSE